MSWNRGFWWPYGSLPLFTAGSGTIDATGEIIACIGRISIAGKATIAAFVEPLYRTILGL